MTYNTKRLCVITGLIAVIIITLLVKTEVSQYETHAIIQINRPAAMKQSIMVSGSQWIIETTCKRLNSNQ